MLGCGKEKPKEEGVCDNRWWRLSDYTEPALSLTLALRSCNYLQLTRVAFFLCSRSTVATTWHAYIPINIIISLEYVLPTRYYHATSYPQWAVKLMSPQVDVGKICIRSIKKEVSCVNSIHICGVAPSLPISSLFGKIHPFESFIGDRRA
jgi:hypothetical protein